MRIFQEEEYEQRAVDRYGEACDDAQCAGTHTKTEEPHEYDEEGLAERVVEEAEVPLVEPRDRRARSDGVHLVAEPVFGVQINHAIRSRQG